MIAAARAFLNNGEVASFALIWLTLVIFGVVMVGSAAIALPGNYLVKHLFYLVVAAVGFMPIIAIPTSLMSRLATPAWFVTIVISVLVLLPGIGLEVNGAKRWLRIAGFTIQASEVAKIGVMLYLASYLARFAQTLPHEPKRLFIPLGMVGLVLGLLIAEPDLGSAVVIMVASAGLLFLAGVKLRYFFLLVAVLLALLVLLIWIEPYRMQRLTSFSDPWSVAFGSGYQLTQALIAFGRGEMFGLGLGESIQKLYYLPEAHNDFIFAVIAEELGAFGTVSVLLVFTLLILKIMKIAKRQLEVRKFFAGYACYFIALVFACQLLISLGVNTGVLPTKGLTLPFVSYGGNSLLVSCAMCAVVFRCLIEEQDSVKGAPRG